MNVEIQRPINTLTSLTNALNRYGSMGWELVGIYNVQINMQFTWFATFKKPSGYLPEHGMIK